jgi:phage tail-like protein
VILEFYNEAGQLALVYNIFCCWPSVYEALPPLDANQAGVAIERLVLENEGWERDQAVQEPKEPA